jgi:protein O-mannosyl-transferase
MTRFEKLVANRRWLVPAVLIAAIVLAYANALRTPFLFDDVGAVVNNPTIRRLDSLAVLSPPTDGSTTTGRPLVNLSFAIDYAIGGERVAIYHATNLAIHVAAALLLFGIVRRTLGVPRVAFFTALSWALHPLQTESVVSIAQRTELLCGLWFLATLYGFIRAIEPGVRAGNWFVVSVAACLLGMATKEVMVVAPLLVLLYDRTFVARSFAAAWAARRRYYVALAGTWLLLGWVVGQSGGARGPSAGFGLGITPWNYLLTQCQALVIYLRLSFWPDPLVFDYGTGVIASLGAVLSQAFAIVVLLAATGWALGRRPALGFIGAWFFLILAPSSSIVPLVTQTIAEHRMYLPVAALTTAIVLFVHQRFGRHAPLPLTAIAIVFGGLTLIRNRDYRDAVSIWTDTAAKRPQNPRAHNNLALALQGRGDAAAANVHFARAVEIDPHYVSARHNWAMALLAQQRPAEAFAQFASAIEIAEVAVSSDAARAANSDLPEAHFQLARLAEQSGDATTAERHYAATLRLRPAHAAAHARLGLLLARLQRLEPAATHLREAIRLAPADVDAQANLGNVLLLQGRPRDALACYEEVLRLRPGDRRTLENIRLAREALR